jgi:hypothetical protein
MKSENFLPAILITIGLSLAGYFIGNGIFKTKALDRYVTVKGLAEREVDANLAIWPISFSEASNDLNALQSELETNTFIIKAFLKERGFDDTEVSVGTQSITDFQASQYYGNAQQRKYRYLGKGKLTVRTTKVGQLVDALGNLSTLIGQGIILADENYYESKVQYLYTDLNQIKPEMIEEATINARQSATKFAQDSGSKVGKIRQANQGLFSINDRDFNSPHKKKIRVVTTVEYYLED